ncbi:MASE1 domain-containing protein [Streptantibioticus ferralitis]|uniref:MASE1 domain-containing protein n=2 Tax=Streptantibioticus ferralitis TaxID=236510 RepID=A0ABT5YZ79_9ACTN|nr:MASE1 domain-containing protein [Streptantibioticus ferralitis]
MAAVVRNEEPRRDATAAVRLVVVAASYIATSWLGETERVVVAGNQVISPLWLPSGIALTYLLYWGMRTWPGIALGALFSELTFLPWHYPLADVGIIAGNTLAPICAYLMLRQVGFRVELGRLRDGLALVFLGALAGTLVNPTLAVGALVLSGRVPADSFWTAWSAWWTGNALGVLVVTPLLLTVRRVRVPRDVPFLQWAEAAALLVGTVVVTFGVTSTSLSLLFLVFPLLIWAALRFQLAGAAPCALVVSVGAVTSATHHTGPFAHHGLVATMVNLQALNGAAALTALLLAAITTERNNTRRKVEDACQELAEVVAHLAPG